MGNVTLNRDGRTFRPIASELTDESLMRLKRLFGERTDWTGKFIRLAWRIATGLFSRVENGVETAGHVFWRWGLRTELEDGVIFILLPELDGDESITIYVEDSADDDKIAESIVEILQKFTKKLEQEIALKQNIFPTNA